MGIFKKKRKELTDDLLPKGVSRTLPRPTEEDIEKISKIVEGMKKTKLITTNVDSFLLQEISDRLYGPDSESYIEALKNLNKDFRPRYGRSGIEFYDPEIVTRTKEREKKIIQSIGKETR